MKKEWFRLTPSATRIPRIVSRKKIHQICDHFELFCVRKITKIYIVWWFSTTLWSPTFPIYSRPIYLYRSSCPDKISDNPRHFFVIQIIKNTKMFHVFGSLNKRKCCVFLSKNCPTWPASARIVRQKHRTNFSSTLTHFLSKCW